jgi:hypothetical protein
MLSNVLLYDAPYGFDAARAAPWGIVFFRQEREGNAFQAVGVGEPRLVLANADGHPQPSAIASGVAKSPSLLLVRVQRGGWLLLHKGLTRGRLLICSRPRVDFVKMKFLRILNVKTELWWGGMRLVEKEPLCQDQTSSDAILTH